MPDDDLSEEELAKAVKGKTLQVYWYMLRHPKPMTAREIQRGTQLSSPSLSMHHLERLKNLGLIEKNVHGEYSLIRDVRVGVLRYYIGKGRLMVPRFLFYATFYTSVTAALFVLLWWFIDWYSSVLIILLVSVCAILWIEAIRTWRDQPFEEEE